MKRFLKRILYFFGFLLVLGGVVYLVFNEPLPQGQKGPEAEALAQSMLRSLNHVNYEKTRFLEWDFNGLHAYKWDRQNHTAEVSWGDHRVLLHLKDYGNSKVFTEGAEVEGEDKYDLIDKAVKYFNNDSFWVVAPFKIYDKGVERRLVKTEEYGDALLVTYTSGGSTPGDSYLWFFDDKGYPIGFKMWVSIIPIGGLEAGWKQWKFTETTTNLPTGHKILFFDLKLNDVKGYGIIE